MAGQRELTGRMSLGIQCTFVRRYRWFGLPEGAKAGLQAAAAGL